MKTSRLVTYCLALVLFQVVISSFLDVWPYLSLSLLPLLIVCIPPKVNSWTLLLIAFAAGVAVDFLSTGMLGLCSIALLPVAFLKTGAFRLVFGDEIFARDNNIPLARQSVDKIVLVTFLAVAVYFFIYVWVETAGTRPFWFCATKWALSTLVSTLVSVFCFNILFTDK